VKRSAIAAWQGAFTGTGTNGLYKLSVAEALEVRVKVLERDFTDSMIKRTYAS
jgi:hypothetical protein